MADFEPLYRANVGYVLHSLRRLGVHDRDLEDVTHDVFLAVYKHIDDLDSTRPVRPWLFGFAFRIARDYRRLARHRHEAASPEHDARDGRRLPDDEVEAERRRRLVILALDKLDLERRAVLVMHDLDGEKMPDIARELALPLNTGYSRLRLARRDFEAALEELAKGKEAAS